jgi:hypothetical protein
MKGLVILVAALSCLLVSAAHAEPLTGSIGSSKKSGSGWIDLNQMTTFNKGDKLRLRIGGTANKIVVRLLSKGQSPDDPIGVDGEAVEVPKNRIIEISLEEKHPEVVQISVHGGPNPWNLFPLGGGNGPATILKAERIP